MKKLAGFFLMLVIAVCSGCRSDGKMLDFSAAPQENIVVLTDDNFEAEVLKSEVVVFVDFWAPWCPPCRDMNPIVAELAKEYNGLPIKFGALDTSKNKKTSDEQKVEYIPRFAIYKDGKIVEELVGRKSKQKLKEMIERHL